MRGYKNHSVLIDALALPEFRDDLAALHLVFTGGSEIHSRDALLARAARAGLAERVRIHDCVSREDLALLYRHATATVVPSLYEQGSFPIYEALHYDCPVACSDIPSLREQCAGLGDAMIYFDPHDVRAVAAAIRTLVRDRSAIRRAQAARAAAAPGRSWADAAEEWLAVFRSAARSFTPPAPARAAA